MSPDDLLANAIAEKSRPLLGAISDWDAVLELTRPATVVLVGEATHGTTEFYRLRAELTKRLIVEQGFTAVAAEADWPDAYRINRYVRHEGPDTDAREALGDFERFPAWMWRNTEIVDFVEWLREFNAGRKAADRVGFYGLDLYSLHASIGAVLAYLKTVDVEAAERARARYACFDHFGRELESYAYATGLGISEACEQQAIAQLVELRNERDALLRRMGSCAEDEFFYAAQNARVVANAEKYYRTMLGGPVASWNLRDTHMADTLDALLVHGARHFDRPKVVVWAHNSHVGDARATQLGDEGELNLGQLARERYPERAILIGFSTYEGTVTAAADWGEAARHVRINPGLPHSYERLFHDIEASSFLLRTRDLDRPEVQAMLREPRLQRAIGVVYKPENERHSHYFHVNLAAQFDAIVHVDRTQALEPLDRSPAFERDEAPETFPTGL